MVFFFFFLNRIAWMDGLGGGVIWKKGNRISGSGLEEGTERVWGGGEMVMALHHYDLGRGKGKGVFAAMGEV